MPYCTVTIPNSAIDGGVGSYRQKLWFDRIPCVGEEICVSTAIGAARYVTITDLWHFWFTRKPEDHETMAHLFCEQKPE